MSKPSIFTDYPSATFLRSFGCMLYDLFLVAAIEFVLLLIIGNIEGFILDAKLPDIARLLLLYICGAGFYVWCWTHGGKTLGMTAWRVEVRAHNGQPIGYKQAWVRALSACLGLGNIWKLVDKNNMAWQDYASGTVLLHDKERQL